MATVDIGNKCVNCLEDTSFGSGKFVNRIPAENEKYEGYQCYECQSIECDGCNQPSLDYNVDLNGNFYCDNCYEEK